jgi:hypothetical protein
MNLDVFITRTDTGVSSGFEGANFPFFLTGFCELHCP